MYNKYILLVIAARSLSSLFICLQFRSLSVAGISYMRPADYSKHRDNLVERREQLETPKSKSQVTATKTEDKQFLKHLRYFHRHSHKCFQRFPIYHPSSSSSSSSPSTSPLASSTIISSPLSLHTTWTSIFLWE